jgi:hypothetical protein
VQKHIFLILIFPFNISKTRFNSNDDLFSLDLITLLIIDKFVLNLSAVLAIALVSLGKHDPP